MRERKSEGRESRKLKHRQSMVARRVAALVLVIAAVALAVCVFSMGPGLARLMWGAACVLLLAEALLLSVDLPVSVALQGVLIAGCVALLALGFRSQFYTRVDGSYVPKYRTVTEMRVEDSYPAHFQQMENLQVLDMRGSTVTDFAPIQALSSLKHLDIRDNYAFDQVEHDALAAALPSCDIRWSIPAYGAHFDSGAAGFDLRPLQLSAAEIQAMMARYPEKNFLYRVPLYGQRYEMDAEALDLRGQTPDVGAIDGALALLSAVETVDLRGAKASAETVAALCDAHPDIHFLFTCDVPGGEMTTEDAEVKVEGSYEQLSEYLAFIPYMPNLETMDAGDIALTNEQVDGINAAGYGAKLKYSVSVFGLKVSSLATELNLDGAPVSSVEEMEETIARLHHLQKVSMFDCGLSEDQMGQLFDNHPDIKFVWYIEFGHYRLRTDATAFSTLLGTGNRYHYNDNTFKALRYCTDLMMLDLGHNRITSLDNFTGLTKLRVLILADNKLTDISQITAFPDLEYVELFLNDITDPSPLTKLTHLQDLNIYHNPLYGNHKVLSSMTWLKRLWIGGCRLSKTDLANLRRALPHTKISVVGRGSTGNGWRKHPHYYTLKQMYEERRYIPFD